MRIAEQNMCSFGLGNPGRHFPIIFGHFYRVKFPPQRLGGQAAVICPERFLTRVRGARSSGAVGFRQNRLAGSWGC